MDMSELVYVAFQRTLRGMILQNQKQLARLLASCYFLKAFCVDFFVGSTNNINSNKVRFSHFSTSMVKVVKNFKRTRLTRWCLGHKTIPPFLINHHYARHLTRQRTHTHLISRIKLIIIKYFVKKINLQLFTPVWWLEKS
jgi:hypothetical protein